MANNSFQAAALQKDITPPLGTLINGEFQTRYANKIHDRLYAKSVVLKQSDTILMFVVVDICAMQQDFLDEVKADIHKATGIPQSHMLISSTHTHSAGAITELLMGHADLTYRKNLHRILVDLVIETLPNLREAKIAFGTVDAPEHVLCRRYKMAPEYKAFNPVTGGYDLVKTNPFGAEEHILERNSTPDTQLAYLGVKGLDDQWIALLANYSLHYVGDLERGTISADYFGCFAKRLEEVLSEGDNSFVAMMSNGTSGEINIWDFIDTGRYPTGSHRKSEFIGRGLSDKVLRDLQNLQWEEYPALEALYNELPVGIRKLSEQELENAKQMVIDTDYESITLNEDGYRRIYAREQVLLAEFPKQRTFYIQSFRIGTGIIGALGGEFFAETGLALKALAPQGKYFTVCLANDYVGYVPPQHEIALGGYETWRCRTSFLEESAEAKIRNVLLKQIEQHKNELV
ncbi:neutral/alkaline non-lysosomal ceramidase N-terminal domain-containing protein [Sphingobacterium chuzhouense]|uniref:Neutral/alkaline non-lysosomal ceramidase N-terminal domain-containing protein n=1 Tax=Sphingobacterium chuzhouense TaxID=1742264 RepID=A0ABR7XMF2_9SPHI|nr:neutral/alkaline non-lysosomal ceramidase N-terminal domain-containing protein [Sphingobacterium chuzhouense]MBD1420037.1 neutral/alkaline non-lysosomal ceramidase N-terminal domain-containing protein [Sphingobacterium chuzhouense]